MDLISLMNPQHWINNFQSLIVRDSIVIKENQFSLKLKTLKNLPIIAILLIAVKTHNKAIYNLRYKNSYYNLCIDLNNSIRTTILIKKLVTYQTGFIVHSY